MFEDYIFHTSMLKDARRYLQLGNNVYIYRFGVDVDEVPKVCEQQQPSQSNSSTSTDTPNQQCTTKTTHGSDIHYAYLPDYEFQNEGIDVDKESRIADNMAGLLTKFIKNNDLTRM